MTPRGRSAGKLLYALQFLLINVVPPPANLMREILPLLEHLRAWQARLIADARYAVTSSEASARERMILRDVYESLKVPSPVEIRYRTSMRLWVSLYPCQVVRSPEGG